MKILVADDEPMLLKTIELKLRKEGYDVIAVTDGREAAARIEHDDPDMVITDMMMPYVSGLDLLSLVRKNKDKHIPVILLTGMEQEKTVMEAFELGADEYITKPFSLNELIIRVKKLSMQVS